MDFRGLGLQDPGHLEGAECTWYGRASIVGISGLDCCCSRLDGCFGLCHNTAAKADRMGQPNTEQRSIKIRIGCVPSALFATEAKRRIHQFLYFLYARPTMIIDLRPSSIINASSLVCCFLPSCLLTECCCSACLTCLGPTFIPTTAPLPTLLCPSTSLNCPCHLVRPSHSMVRAY